MSKGEILDTMETTNAFDSKWQRCTPDAQPLGRWLVPAKELRKPWTHLYDPVSEKLFHNTSAGYTQHSKITVDYDQTPDQDVVDPVIPLHAIPVDTIVEYPPTLDTTRPQRVVAANETVLEWVLLLETLELTDSTEDAIWRELCTGRCYIATDGSAPKGKGSFTWFICNNNGNTLAKYNGPVFGAKISSYRSEAYGILSAL
jgi:hypothetical protein